MTAPSIEPPHAFYGIPTVGLFRFDPEGTCVFVNGRWSEMTGIPRDKAAGLKWATFLHPDDVERVRREWVDRSPGMETVRTEWRYVRPDGSIVWALAEVTPERSATGSVTGYLGCVTDITDRKNREDHLSSQKEVMEMIVAGAPLADVLTELTSSVERQSPGLLCSVWLLDEDGTHLRTGAAPSLPEEIVRLTHGLAIGPTAGSCGTAAYRREPVIVTDIAADPLWAPFRDTALRYGLRACWSLPMLAADGTVLGTFAIYYREPRAATSAEHAMVTAAARYAGIAVERHHTTAVLRANQRMLLAITDGTKNVIFVKDLNGRYLLVNKEFRNAFQIDDALGKTDFDLFPQAEATAFVDADRRAVDTRRPVETVETVMQRDGLHTYLTIKTALHDDHGEPYAVCGISADITERQRLEDQLQQAQKMEALGRLASGVAHDFNNLLTAILSNAEWIGTSATDLGSRDAASEIQRAVHIASSLTKQLLAFSRRQMRQMLVVDVNEVVSSMEGLLQRLATRAISFEWMPARTRVSVRMDRSQLEQVVLNLVVNACDAMPGGGCVRVTTDTLHVDEAEAARLGIPTAGVFSSLEVSDTGVGISAKTRERIFEPFFSTKDPQRGTGLGLATVYGICQQNGGFVLVRSEEGKGSTFTVLLPYEDVEATSAPTPEPVPVPTDAATVLVVDDEEPVRRVLARVLETAGYRVLTADGAAAALQLVESTSEPIHLLVSDVMMPGMNGVELARRVLAQRAGTRLLLISGNPDNAAFTSLGDLPPGTAFLSKPVTGGDLKSAVRQALRTPPHQASVPR